MCATPPKPKNKTQIEVKPPEIQLGSDNPSAAARGILKRGRSQLRSDIGLGIPLPPTSGVSIPVVYPGTQERDRTPRSFF